MIDSIEQWASADPHADFILWHALDRGSDHPLAHITYSLAANTGSEDRTHDLSRVRQTS